MLKKVLWNFCHQNTYNFGKISPKKTVPWFVKVTFRQPFDAGSRSLKAALKMQGWYGNTYNQSLDEQPGLNNVVKVKRTFESKNGR